MTAPASSTQSDDVPSTAASSSPASDARILPDRPDLRFLRDEAKSRQRAGEFESRSEALLAIAREHGVPSWPALKVQVEDKLASFEERVAAFLDASVPRATVDHRGGGLTRADQLLSADPAIAKANVCTAAVLGDADEVERRLARDATLASLAGGPRDWPPLLYTVFSRFLRLQPEREADADQVVELLLEAGADPNASFHNPDDPVGTETALYGAAGVVRSPAITRRLLTAGADPNDGEVAYHVVGEEDTGCLEAWLSAGPDQKHLVTAMQRTMDYDDEPGLRLTLEAGADPNALSVWGHRALHFAARRWKSVDVADLLLEFGADPDQPDAEGRSAYVVSARLGHADFAAHVAERGADTSLSPLERFITACASGDEATARTVLAAEPDLMSTLSAADHGLLAEAARAGHLKAARLMLDLEFDITAGEHGYTGLHWAAHNGHGDVVDLLLDRGADPGRRDPHYHASAWGWAGAGEHPELGRRIAERASGEGNVFAAVLLGDVKQLETLLTSDPALANRFDGWTTPLCAAAESGRDEIVALILKHGADASITRADGIAPRELALNGGHTEVAARIDSGL